MWEDVGGYCPHCPLDDIIYYFLSAGALYCCEKLGLWSFFLDILDYPTWGPNKGVDQWHEKTIFKVYDNIGSGRFWRIPPKYWLGVLGGLKARKGLTYNTVVRRRKWWGTRSSWMSCITWVSASCWRSFSRWEGTELWVFPTPITL